MGLPNFQPVGSFTGQILSAGSNSVIADGFTGVVVGQGITGPGIPSGDTITGITSLGFGISNVTLALPATWPVAAAIFSTGPFFLKLDQYGGTDYQNIGVSNLLGENTLDIETIHALVLEANIIDVDSPVSGSFDAATAIVTAMSYPGVTVISRSASTPQTSSSTGQIYTDPTFLPPASNPNVTFVNSTGDNFKAIPGNPADTPATSPYVLAVGASQSTTDPQGNYLGELGLYETDNGPSNDEPQPS